jgi:two-component system response regulator
MRRVFLVIDDNSKDAAGTQRQLQLIDPQAEVLVAADGDSALALLTERRVAPSLVCLDYALGGRNGIEILSEIRTQRWLERVPVVMLTEPIADRLVVNCYRLGAAAFLTKPVSTYELKETVRDFAQETRQLAAASLVTGATGQSQANAA